MIDEAKRELVTKFYYNISRLMDSMKEHQTYLQTLNLCRNRKKVAEKNEFGKMREEQEKEIKQWEGHIEKNEKMSEERIKDAIEAFDIMVGLLNGD